MMNLEGEIHRIGNLVIGIVLVCSSVCQFFHPEMFQKKNEKMCSAERVRALIFFFFFSPVVVCLHFKMVSLVLFTLSSCISCFAFRVGLIVPIKKK